MSVPAPIIVIAYTADIRYDPEDKWASRPTVWPEGWPLPKPGDYVELLSAGVYVRRVGFHPQGQPGPFIEIVMSATPPMML